MKIKNFEDIEAWKEARNLNKLVYQISRKDPFRKDFGLTGHVHCLIFGFGNSKSLVCSFRLGVHKGGPIQNPLRSDNEGKETHKRLHRLPKGQKA